MPLTDEERIRIVEEEQLRANVRAQANAKQNTAGCLGCLGFLGLIGAVSGAIWLFTKPMKFIPWLCGGLILSLLIGGGMSWTLKRDWWKFAAAALTLAGLGFWLIAGGDKA